LALGREQARLAMWEAGADLGLLVADRLGETRRDRHVPLALELVVVVAQVGSAGGVDRQRIDRQMAGVDRAQAGLDQDEHERARGAVRNLIERLVAFELRDDRLVEEAREALGLWSELAPVIGGVGRQSRRPVMATEVV